ESQIDLQIAFTGECIGHREGRARFHRLHPVVEIIDVDRQELAFIHRWQRLFGIARKVRHHTHDEWDLHFFLGPVQLDVILDLHAWRAVTRDEFLAALLGHRTPPTDLFSIDVYLALRHAEATPPHPGCHPRA